MLLFGMGVWHNEANQLEQFLLFGPSVSSAVVIVALSSSWGALCTCVPMHMRPGCDMHAVHTCSAFSPLGRDTGLRLKTNLQREHSKITRHVDA